MDTPGPCDWPYYGCPCSSVLDSPGEPQLEIIELAKSMLWRATGQVYGPCPISVLPCVGDAACGCGRDLRSCGCRRIPEIKLPGPIWSVQSVTVDGDLLDPTAYRVDDYHWLVRTDGGSWPTMTDQLDPNSFRVDYSLGMPPPSGAGLMAGILACEWAKAACDDDTCRLPWRIRRLARAGVTVEWAPGQGFGLEDVDTWVANAMLPLRAGAVSSPDVRPVRRITWEHTP